MKFLFLVGGSLGEFSQAESLAIFLKSKNIPIRFLIQSLEVFEKLCQKNNFDYDIVHNFKETEYLINRYQPQVLFLCCSKTVKKLIKHKPKRKTLVATLDSNWIFNNCGEMTKVFPWIDVIFVVMPKKVFNLGLYENGGHYKISKKNLAKIYCPGFIPSGKDFNFGQIKKARKCFGLENKEKLIYLYLGRKDTFRWYFLVILTYVFDELYKNYKNFKVLFIGDQKIERPWAISINWIEDTEYLENIIAASDLVIQHHGLGNLPKAIRAGVPAICLTPKIYPNMPNYIHSQYYEIEPFAKLGLCINTQFVTPLDTYLTNIKNLLFDSKIRNRMIKKQKEIFSPGEENLYKFILKKLDKK